MATTKVTMVVTTRLDGDPYLAGHTYDVDKDTADRWVDLGIAEAGAQKRKAGELTTHQQAQQSVMESDLEVAAQHGDVAAARRLDAHRAGTQPLEPVTPAEEPAAATGESARGALSKG